MPQDPPAKPRAHPAAQSSVAACVTGSERAGGEGGAYAELQTTSNFTFLTGASHPDELVERAAELGHRAVAITDRNTLAGIVRAHVAAKRAGVPLVVGCRVEVCEPYRLSMLVYACDRGAYAALCRLLTLGKRRAAKGECRLSLHDVLECAGGGGERSERGERGNRGNRGGGRGLLAVVVPPEGGAGVGLGVGLGVGAGGARVPHFSEEVFVETLAGLREVFDDDRLSLAASMLYTQGARERLERLAALSRHTRVPLVAVNDVHAHRRERRALQDVLACIRAGVTVDRAGLLLHAHGERHMKPACEMGRLFAGHPGAQRRGVEIAERAGRFSLDELRYEYPDEVVPAGETAMSHLTALAWRGAGERYPGGVPGKVRDLIGHELRLIDELGYARYFLTVEDLVRFARSRGILCQGRGAAANSAVCYCLGVTGVDPERVSMLFERFISRERGEPPDIDIDFEHERREEVIQYLYKKYGRDRAALTAEVISYRGRSAVRDVGKALGLPLDVVGALAREIDWWSGSPTEAARVREIGLDPCEPRVAMTLGLARELIGFPRHLSQHVGGFVITRTALSELVPIENAAMEGRTVIEWDKDDVDAMGMLKVDCLGLGMLTCIRKCLGMGAVTGGPTRITDIPGEDPETYDMICGADTVGVFQIESRAQMSMLPRLKPRCYYDLVIEVAIVRPGPIQGKMVHPYLKRRESKEAVVYASPEIERVLGRTLGVPLFQEQAMALAVAAAGFTAGEADRLRRAMSAWKRSGKAILEFERRLVEGMLERGYSREFAGQVFQQITGFSGYGFPESHAASFAHLVYASAWLKRHHPAEFAAALINSQPMGFYRPAQIVRDAQAHGVEVRGVDVNHSAWDCTLERSEQGGGAGLLALRLGMRLVRGLEQRDAELVCRAARAGGGFGTVERLWRGSGVGVAGLRRLAEADAFGSMGLSRQRALWELRALRDVEMPLFDRVDERGLGEGGDGLPVIPGERQVSCDYGAVGLSLKAHPVSFIREHLAALGAVESAALADAERCPNGRRVKVAGIVLVRQRPGTASGILFMTLEDETGVANLIVRPRVFERFRRAARHAHTLLCEGTVERQGRVVHVMAARVRSLDALTADPAGALAMSRDFH